MKKVLILVLSCQEHPYGSMIDTSMATWDSIPVEGAETIFYCGRPVRESTSRIIYLPVKENLFTMGEKTLQAYEWAINNKQFDYIARVNSSCYVNKQELVRAIQALPEKDLFQGLIVNPLSSTDRWMWGGGQFIISRDVIQKFLENRHLWNHSLMEDKSHSYLANRLGVPYSDGMACSVNKAPDGWLCFGYGTDNFNFVDFADMKKATGQYFFRVKQDGQRHLEAGIMQELFKHLT